VVAPRPATAFNLAQGADEKYMVDVCCWRLAEFINGSRMSNSATVGSLQASTGMSELWLLTFFLAD